MRLNKVLEEQLGKMSLSDDEIKNFRKIANSFIKKLKKKGVKVFIGGSFAKGTAVKKDSLQDIDIFVMFDKESDTKKLGALLKGIDVGGYLRKVHGSRDYYQVVMPEVILELIPVVKNIDPAKANNVTDVSMLHVDYVVKKLKENPVLNNEIKLAKSFVRANKCYGAESYIKGFSGYSLELLVIYFGGFVNFLKKISKVDVLDPEKYFSGKKQIMMELNSSKLQSPIVVVDPTYKYRNVCAGLGIETFSKFIKIAQAFLQNPNSDFFEFKNIDILELRKIAEKNKARYVEIEFTTDKQEGDVAGSKMKKYFDFIIKEFERNGQTVFYTDFYYLGYGKSSKGYIIVIEKFVIEREGPPVNLIEQVDKFRKLHGVNIVEKKGVLYVKVEISLNNLLMKIKKFEKEMFVKINRLIIE